MENKNYNSRLNEMSLLELEAERKDLETVKKDYILGKYLPTFFHAHKQYDDAYYKLLEVNVRIDNKKRLPLNANNLELKSLNP